MHTESAGGVVLNTKDEVAVVSQHGDSWSLPKGHIDPGEDALQAAQREVREETGLTDIVLVRDLGFYERYRIAKGGVGEDTAELKRIHMFLFTTKTETLAPEDPENPAARWVPTEGVSALLTHPKDKEFFESIKDSLK
ncbi:MAG: NUDIX domain-containing protein [Minisyncoccia bacterium]